MDGNKINILMVSDFFYPNFGGVENHIYYLSLCLIKLGHKVVVLTHAYGNRTGVRYMTGGLKVYYIPWRPFVLQNTLPTLYGTLPIIRTVIIRENITLVHGHQAFSTLCHEALMHAHTMGYKSVFTDHSLYGFADVGSIHMNKVLQFTLADISQAICVSHTSKENTVLRSGLPPEKVFVIPNAVDTAIFRPASTRRIGPEIVVVVISRLVYRKGADLLVEVIPSVCRLYPNVRFIIGGDGPKRARLEEMRENHSLQDRVELLGTIPHAQVRSILICGHIFLNSSLTEAFCIAILEAASCGLLTVSTRVGGVPEVLPEDMIVLSEPNPSDMVEAIKKAILMVPKIDPQAMHIRMKKLYSWYDVARRTEIVYDHALKCPNKCLIDRLPRYLSCGAWAGKLFCLVMVVDFVLWKLLQLLQVLLWVVLPFLERELQGDVKLKAMARSIMLLSYLSRLYLIIPLSLTALKLSSILTVRASISAFYNLVMYLLASHVVGAMWYMMVGDAQEVCWKRACRGERTSPADRGRLFLDYCGGLRNRDSGSWPESANVSLFCSTSSDVYNFGIFEEGVKKGVAYAPFFQRFLFCLWWGLKNLSSLGQGLFPSTSTGEILFAVFITTLGLLLFSLLIGNMQMFLQSTTMRQEEWRVRKSDREEWMRDRQLPRELRQRVRKYEHSKWMATRGVDEEALLRCLPTALRRDIKRHLCFHLLRQVPMLEGIEERVLDIICDRMKPGVWTKGMTLAREGDPAGEMVFVIRGYLDCYTTYGGGGCRIGPGGFVGEELLAFAVSPPTGPAAPASARTVKAASEVEAFTVSAEDLRLTVSRLQRVNGRRMCCSLRSHSHLWRTWAVCCIQVAWRLRRRRRCTRVGGMNLPKYP